MSKILTCKPTVILKRAISFSPAFREIGCEKLKAKFKPFPDALPVKDNEEHSTTETALYYVEHLFKRMYTERKKSDHI